MRSRVPSGLAALLAALAPSATVVVVVPAVPCVGAFAPPLPSRAAAFAPPSALTSATGNGLAGPRSGYRSSSGAVAADLTRARLFRDLLKRVRGDDGGGGDDDEEKDDRKKKKEGGGEGEAAAESKAPDDGDGRKEADGEGGGKNAPFFARLTSDDGEETKKEEEGAPEVDEAVPASLEGAAPAPEPTPVAAVAAVEPVVAEGETETSVEETIVEEEGGKAEAEVEVDPETVLAAAALAAAAATTPAAAAAKPEPKAEPAPPAPPAAAAKKEPPPSPVEEARALRAAAERARLEAERMDAELTLEKISKLERELATRAVSEDAKRATAIRDQLDQLNKKLTGEDAVPVAAKKKEEAGAFSTVSPLYSRNATTGETTLSTDALGTTAKASSVVVPGTEPLSEEELSRRVALFERSPDFLKLLAARTAGFDGVQTAADVNGTALILRLHEDDVAFRKNQAEVEAENSDLAELKRALELSGGEVTVVDLSDASEKPTFTQEQIDAKVKDLEAVPQFVKNLFPDNVAKNDTALAIKMLTDDWENEQMRNSLWGGGDKKKKKEEKSEGSQGSALFGAGRDDLSETDRMVQSLFPRQVTEREDDTAPSEATMKVLMEDVLTKVKLFSPSGQPEKVPGGFLVRGVNSYDDGRALIDAVDAQMARSPRAQGRALVHYVSDPTPVTEEQLAMGDRDPVLLVTGPELGREANRFLLAGISAVAVGTSWYMALYPFLINPDILSRAEEQVTLANAGMEYNLDWLTAQAVPLYAGFVAAIAAHELAHRVAASAYGMNVTVPTLIPSLVSGVTGQITALKDSPRDRQQLLDFALAGPIAGMATSAALLFAGCGLTATADAASYANFPALPVDILRQSSLGGGIIEAMLGGGVLSVPASAAAYRAVAEINISLHPLAIAGFFGLLVNACALLPFGRTDGGRVALALFGRSGAQLVGLITLVTLFFAGLTLSDLLLFYFSFIAFFQGELEIPCRNEVDEVDFSRVLLATAGGVLVLLSLIPMV